MIGAISPLWAGSTTTGDRAVRVRLVHAGRVEHDPAAAAVAEAQPGGPVVVPERDRARL